MDKDQCILINKAGNGNYTDEGDIGRLIQYITRQNSRPDSDLFAWGALGTMESHGVETVIRHFKAAQKTHTRKGNFGRYIDHEIFSIPHEKEQEIYLACIDMDSLAREMAYDFYENDHCQVVYGVHRPTGSDKHLHIHFAINAVNYQNGNKRRENRTQTAERQNRFNEILDKALKK